MTLENRTVVITGASSALGLQLAGEVSRAGANLALLERDPAKLGPLTDVTELPAHRVLKHAVDLLDREAARAAGDAVRSHFGRVDVLIHLVGGWIGGKTIPETPHADLESMLDQHVWTTFNTLQAFVPHLVANRWGRILVVSSPAATRPSAKGGAYAAGKAAQEALMLTASQELKGTGVTANLLVVRAIDAKREKVSAPGKENESWSTPEEMTAVVRFLLSDEAGTINGARLPLFGSYV